MIELISVYDIDQRHDILFQLLGERTPLQSISHKKMPEMADHIEFVESQPYLEWNFIHCPEQGIVGSIYLTKLFEIGIGVFTQHQREGYASKAIQLLMDKHQNYTFLANINPANTASINLFEGLGAKHIQNTYEL